MVMIKSSAYKIYTFINCERRVELPKKVDHYTIDGFTTVMESQLCLEKGTRSRKSKKRRATLRLYPEVLKLIEKYHGTFYQWRRDLCTGVIIIEVLFDDLNDFYGYGYEVDRFPNISSKYVYSVVFDGKNHISMDAREYRYPKRMSKIMVEAAEKDDSVDQQNFYYGMSYFLEFLDKMPIYKIKLFKNRNGHLVVDIMFKLYHDFLIFKKEMDRKSKHDLAIAN